MGWTGPMQQSASFAAVRRSSRRQVDRPSLSGFPVLEECVRPEWNAAVVGPLGRLPVGGHGYAHPCDRTIPTSSSVCASPPAASVATSGSIDVVSVDADALLKDACAVFQSGEEISVAPHN